MLVLSSNIKFFRSRLILSYSNHVTFLSCKILFLVHSNINTFFFLWCSLSQWRCSLGNLAVGIFYAIDLQSSLSFSTMTMLKGVEMLLNEGASCQARRRQPNDTMKAFCLDRQANLQSEIMWEKGSKPKSWQASLLVPHKRDCQVDLINK